MKLPFMSSDPVDKVLKYAQGVDPYFSMTSYKLMKSFPIASDYELLLHYLRGAAGPFVDIKRHVELGVGWKLKPVGFESDEDGAAAKKIVDEVFKKMKMEKTMKQLSAFYRVLGRGALVDTYSLDGSYYYNKKEKIKGIDVINPITLDPESVEKVMADTTGTAKYKQVSNTLTGSFKTVELEQERVTFVTNNEFSDNSPVGNSDLQPAIKDLRTIAQFPGYRDEMAALYSTMLLIIENSAEAIADTEYGEKIKKSATEAQALLDDTAEFYRAQKGKGNIVSIFDWQKVIPISFAGKEVKIAELEKATIESIARNMKVPLPLLSLHDIPNRETLNTVTDVFVQQIGNGGRKEVYTPIIEEKAAKVLEIEGITEGRMEVQYNPFLPKDLLKVAQILSTIWPTGAISAPEIREEVDLPSVMNTGGDEWNDRNVLPSQTTPTYQADLNQFQPSQTPTQIKSVDKDWEILKKTMLQQRMIKQVS